MLASPFSRRKAKTLIPLPPTPSKKKKRKKERKKRYDGCFTNPNVALPPTLLSLEG
jgi:hypothetical protein